MGEGGGEVGGEGSGVEREWVERVAGTANVYLGCV